MLKKTLNWNVHPLACPAVYFTGHSAGQLTEVNCPTRDKTKPALAEAS
jgi:hypothetical protein